MNTSKGKLLKRVSLHVAGCVLFLAVPFFIGPEGVHTLSDLKTNPHLQREVIAFVLLLGFFYLNYFLLIPRLFFLKKYLIYVLLLAVIFFLIVKIPQLFVPLHHSFTKDIPPFGGKFGPPAPNKSLFFIMSHNLFVFLAVVFFSIVRNVSYRLKLTEKEKLNSELLYLRSQINPHFLFNTLNSIYSLAIDKSEYTATAVVKLSGMMRYVIHETDAEFVPMEKEIEYISDYVELQKIRIDEATKVTYEVKGDVAGKKITPLILILFIENAFKFGVSPEENSGIEIKIEVVSHNLTMIVKNNKVHIPEDQKKKSGLGIENAKARLELLYPGKHNLIIWDNEQEFFVTLKLDLD